MKTMTCRALGGPCDLEHHGESADDVINAQDRHLKEAEEGRRRDPPGGPRRHEEPLAAPQEVDGLVPRHQAGLRRPPRRLTPLSVLRDAPRLRDSTQGAAPIRPQNGQFRAFTLRGMEARMAWVWQGSASSPLGFGVEVALFGDGVGECGRPLIGVRGFRASQGVK